MVCLFQLSNDGVIYNLVECLYVFCVQAVEVYICRVKPKDRESMWPKHVSFIVV